MPKGIYKRIEYHNNISRNNLPKNTIVPMNVRIKISNALKGIKRPPLSKDHREKISKALKGRKLSKETRKKMSKAKKGRKILWGDKISKTQRGTYTGKLGTNWQGGITPLMKLIRAHPKYKEWHSKVLSIYNYTCQECFIRGGILDVHHIKQFAIIVNENKIKTLEEALKCEELWDVNNGLVLCKKCHSKEKKKIKFYENI